MDALLTDIDAAEMLRISTRSLARLTRERRIPHIRLPDGQVRYNTAALREWVSCLEIRPDSTEVPHAS